MRIALSPGQWQPWTAVSPLWGSSAWHNRRVNERGKPVFERPFNAEASAKHWSGFVNSLSLYFLYFVRIVPPRIALLAAGNTFVNLFVY